MSFYNDPASNQTGAIRPECAEMYTVKSGDTLYGIALKFNVPLPMLIFSNRNVNPYYLKVGQQICIPKVKPPGAPGTHPGCRSGMMPYVIQAGDTLYSIAKENNTTIEAILNENKNIDPYNLIPGMKICIPAKDSTQPVSSPVPDSGSIPESESQPSFSPETDSGLRPAPGSISCPNGKIYKIERNDTLTKILLTHNYSYAALLHSNPNTDLTRLKEGMEICIPNKDIFGGCQSGRTYVTVKGDSVVSIAEKFAVKTDDLMICNPALRPIDFSIPNTRVCIPRQGSI